MKKIAGFIVEKRKVILVVFALLTLISAWLATKVTVNYDMTRYLPEDSSVKAGLEIMGAEFPTANSVYVMFKGLSESEKSDIFNGLSNNTNVQSVSYETGSDKYNKDGYTLYMVSMDCGAYSVEAKKVIAAIEEQYASYDVSLSGEAAGMQDLTFIFIPAIAILLIILFLMSQSWIEPLILLGNIGVAIVINMGTNAVFDNVSEITQAIAAILQLVLSMDYSIMLINRYRQEKEVTDNKYDAMKKALRGAFTAISSSSVTTIVGMLMLVFMSFTIGMDLGLVIAKGVFFSLLCVFTVMPALVVMTDKLIEKTAKPSLHFKMTKIASFAYSARYIILAVFIVLFAGGFVMRNDVGIGYTISAYDEVYQTFAVGNPIVVLYENKDEEKIAAIAGEWEGNGFVDSVNAYATTLGKELTSAEFADAADMDKTMSDLLYYYYFNGKTMSEGRAIPLSDFLRFIQENVAENETFSETFTEDTQERLDMLTLFTDHDRLAGNLTSAEIANIFGMEESAVRQLFLYYDSMYDDSMYGGADFGTMPLSTFVSFVINDIAENEAFSDSFDRNTLGRLRTAQIMIDGVLTGKAFTAAEMTVLLGLDSNMMDKVALDLLYLFYFSKQEAKPEWKLPVYDFMRFIVNDIASDERFSAFFSGDTMIELNKNAAEMDDGLRRLVGANFSRMILNTSLPEESDETFAFIANLEDELNSTLSGAYYLIGNSAVAYEMAGEFQGELDFITILTAISIFLVVMLAFRSLSIPLILVCLIQCAVFITMGTVYIQGSNIYYLALLIVQCLMMGATIDYGILYTSYYTEARASKDIKESIAAALNHAIHTVMTSGLILVTVTLVLGIMIVGQNYAISEILLIIARGCFCAMILVVFVLPSLLAVLDKFVVRRKIL